MKKFGILVVVFIVCVAFLSSYANADVETEKISLNGSTSMEKMVNALKEGLEDKYPELLIEPQFTGSSAGIEAVLNGTTDIGNSHQIGLHHYKNPCIAYCPRRNRLPAYIYPACQLYKSGSLLSSW